MKITVTESDILNGIRHDSHQCPIARAISRKTGSADVHVASPYITVATKWYDTPVSVKAFIRAYDDHALVVPLEFDLC